MTSSMGQKRWKDSWSDSGRRVSGLEGPVAAMTGPGSEVSSLTDYSLERPHTRDTASTSFLLREQSAVSSRVDSSSYQEKLQGWSTVFPDRGGPAPRPGTSINCPRAHNLHAAAEHDASFLQSRRATDAFPDKPRELYGPLDGLLPSHRLVAQRKYLVLPSIGHAGGLFLRRQHTSLDTLNQLDYSRAQLEDDADFFAELIELKRETSHSATPLPARGPAHPPLPPIAKLRHSVRPRTNIAELDEDRLALSGRVSAADDDESDVEEFRGQTPDPDYADTSPTRLLRLLHSPHPRSRRSSASGSACGGGGGEGRDGGERRASDSGQR